MAKKTVKKAAVKKSASKTVPLTLCMLNLSAPGPLRVSVAGTFNDWNPDAHPLVRDRGGVWKKTLRLRRGVYEYKFIVDGQWQTDPANPECVPNSFGTLNSVLKV